MNEGYDKAVALAEYLSSTDSMILQSADLRLAMTFLSLLGASLSIKKDTLHLDMLAAAFDVLAGAILCYKEEEEKLLGGLE